MTRYKLYHGDAGSVLKIVQNDSVDCVVTSPPYFQLRQYKEEIDDKEIGQERNVHDYITNLVNVFNNVKPILKDSGTLWVVIGDTYVKSDPQYSRKCLYGVPWRFALAMIDAGWILRQDVIWNKVKPIPHPVIDRCVTAHEYVFLFTKKPTYYWDYKASLEPALTTTPPRKKTPKKLAKSHKPGQKHIARTSMSGPQIHNGEFVRIRRSVWSVTTAPFDASRYETPETPLMEHFATYPQKLIEPCILMGSPVGGVVLDPFNGAGTTGVVALKNDRNYIGIDLNSEYLRLTAARIENECDIRPLNASPAVVKPPSLF